MKKLLALALLSVAFVGCGGKGGLPACTSKHEVKEILTGVKQGCSGSAGIVKAASISREDAPEVLNGTFTNSDSADASVVVSLKGTKFYAITVYHIPSGDFVVAFKNELTDEQLDSMSIVDGNIHVPGPEIFDANGDPTGTFENIVYLKEFPELQGDLNDDNILVFTSQLDFEEYVKTNFGEE